MKFFTKASFAALACLAVMPLTSSAPANNHMKGKVTICHVPPGNPANAHLITVSVNAVKAHRDHGDPIDANGNPTGGCGCATPTPIDPVVTDPIVTDPVVTEPIYDGGGAM